MEVGGKFLIVGMYTGSIAIPEDLVVAPQLVFLFLMATGIEEQFKTLTVEVTLPETAPISQNIPLQPQDTDSPFFQETKRLGAQRIIHRVPLFIPQPQLRPGKVLAKVIHEKGELLAIGSPFIVRAQNLPLQVVAAKPPQETEKAS
jgi:hypothetical protein